MISDKIVEALNKQLNRELYSAYLYLAMASWFDSRNLKGFAHWMKVQAREEVEHAMKFYEYINDRGGRVVLEDIKAVQIEWKSVTEVFEYALEHERNVTRYIHELFNLARSEGDRATEVFLHWFINEQVEEEKTFSEILQILKYAGETPQIVLILDRQLAERK
ncbi:Ferroxidase [Ignisphaera aggregans DSM 17230]|uniref:Ferroxidase n=1 Tax=Ignisphaera aggregans (strain DSM 17230 / JCM 13409 / AQ1.S1) TaxID=583356 RepID=E0SQ04_IGNAA|nr:Ferroxidase [Ignisphaera aggregans DSM 17230]